MKTEKFYIDFMLDTIRKIENCIAKISFVDFKNNQEKQSTVILQLILIGETAKKLSNETKNKMDLPWKQIIGFRDMAVHDYTNLNLDAIWDTANKDIPQLKEKLQNYGK